MPALQALTRPDEEAIAETTQKTAAALQLMVTNKVAITNPSTLPSQPGGPTYIKYTPSQQGAQYASGAGQRIIKMQVHWGVPSPHRRRYSPRARQKSDGNDLEYWHGGAHRYPARMAVLYPQSSIAGPSIGPARASQVPPHQGTPGPGIPAGTGAALASKEGLCPGPAELEDPSVHLQLEERKGGSSYPYALVCVLWSTVSASGRVGGTGPPSRHACTGGHPSRIARS